MTICVKPSHTNFLFSNCAEGLYNWSMSHKKHNISNMGFTDKTTMVTTSIIQRIATEQRQQQSESCVQAAVREVEEVMISGLVHMHTVQTGALTHHSTLTVRTGLLAHNQEQRGKKQERNSTQGDLCFRKAMCLSTALTTHTVYCKHLYPHAVFKNCD